MLDDQFSARIEGVAGVPLVCQRWGHPPPPSAPHSSWTCQPAPGGPWPQDPCPGCSCDHLPPRPVAKKPENSKFNQSINQELVI